MIHIHPHNSEPLFDIYLCSFGRSSLPFAIDSIEQQSIPVDTKLFAYEELCDIQNYACKNCKKPFFLRMDEDMFLHPKAVEFISHRCKEIVKATPIVPMIPFMVYDIDSRKPIQSIKLYKTAMASNHEFYDDGDWGLDINFIKFLNEKFLAWKMEDSVLAVHASIPKEERDKYITNMFNRYPDLRNIKMWPQLDSPCSLEYQYDNTKKVLNESNKEGNTEFYRWL